MESTIKKLSDTFPVEPLFYNGIRDPVHKSFKYQPLRMLKTSSAKEKARFWRASKSINVQCTAAQKLFGLVSRIARLRI